MLSYIKHSDDKRSFVWCVVSFDQHNVQEGYCSVPKGILPAGGFRVKELLTGEEYWWNGSANYVRLDPGYWPAHVFEVKF